MRHTVKMHGITIGWSELEHRDELTGRVWGAFRPAAGWELVEPVFQLFVEAVPLKGGEPMDREKLDRYLAARDQLVLELVDASGARVPAGTIHITPYRSGIEVEVLMA